VPWPLWTVTLAADTGPAGPALVVLAAGASTRLGEHKALVDIRGEPAILHLLRAARRLGDAQPLVITGADEGAIAQALGQLTRAEDNIEIVHNPHWASGRSSSLALARELRAQRDVCLAPVDCPLVSPDVFKHLARCWAAEGRPPRGWLAPRHGTCSQTGHGHPVVLGHELLSEWDGLESPRKLRDRAQPLLSVPVGDPAILDNLDRPADLARLRARR